MEERGGEIPRQQNLEEGEGKAFPVPHELATAGGSRARATGAHPLSSLSLSTTLAVTPLRRRRGEERRGAFITRLQVRRVIKCSYSLPPPARLLKRPFSVLPLTSPHLTPVQRLALAVIILSTSIFLTTSRRAEDLLLEWLFVWWRGEGDGRRRRGGRDEGAAGGRLPGGQEGGGAGARQQHLRRLLPRSAPFPSMARILFNGCRSIFLAASRAFALEHVCKLQSIIHRHRPMFSIFLPSPLLCCF